MPFPVSIYISLLSFPEKIKTKPILILINNNLNYFLLEFAQGRYFFTCFMYYKAQ